MLVLVLSCDAAEVEALKKKEKKELVRKVLRAHAEKAQKSKEKADKKAELQLETKQKSETQQAEAKAKKESLGKKEAAEASR